MKSCWPLRPHFPFSSLPDNSWIIPPSSSPQHVCTCCSLCWEGFPSLSLDSIFKSCAIFSFLSIRLKDHLLREACPDPLCKVASEALCSFFFFITFISNWNDFISAFMVQLLYLNGSSTRAGTQSVSFISLPSGSKIELGTLQSLNKYWWSG